MNSLLVRPLWNPVVRARVVSNSSRLLSWTATQDAVRVASTAKEGDVWDHNYSLTEDGVVNTKLAYRNANISTILNNLPAKAVDGKVEIDGINYQGKYKVVEAGEDAMDHDRFEEVLEEQHDYLSSDKILFFEDFGLGSCSSSRVGARMISDNPAHALIFRSLMINIPPRPTDHRARYNGWNLDQRWEVTDYVWNGVEYDFVTDQANLVGPRRGERPVIAFLGGGRVDERDSVVALQFAQLTGEKGGIAGANIVAGGSASIRGILDAYGQAAAAMINEESPQSLTIPSVTSSKGSQTILFVGSFSDDFVNKVYSKGSLYGAYFNTISPTCVSTLFGGFIGPAKSMRVPDSAPSFLTQHSHSPLIVSGSVTTVNLSPDNAVASPSTFVFVDPSASSISVDEAASRLLQSCGSDDDESKISTAKSLLGSGKVVVVKTEKEAEKYIL